jgi:RNA polymerase sigma-70 factor (ECF subfamily)
VLATAVPSATLDSPRRDERWIANFHAGDAVSMTAVYREHFEVVRSAVAAVLSGADCETVIHEVFFRLLSVDKLRQAYQGGSFASWLFAVAKHQAIDYARRRARETPDGLVPTREGAAVHIERQLEARVLVQQFRREVLPAEWHDVFEARFIQQLDQREAARSLGIPRTTLLYREHRIRALLRSFLLHPEKRYGRA